MESLRLGGTLSRPLLAGRVVSLDWGGRRLLLLLLLLPLALHLLDGAVLPAHTIIGFHPSGLHGALVAADGAFAFLPFLRKFGVFILIILVVPLYVFVLFFFVVPDSRGIATNAERVFEVNASGVLGRLAVGYGGRGMWLIGACARRIEPVTGLLKFGLGSRRELRKLH